MNLGDTLWMQRVVGEEQARLRGYQAAWDAYFGRFKKPLTVKKNQPDDNVIVNFVRLISDISVAYLFGLEPGFELDTSGEESPAEEWLNECWRLNHKMLLLQKVALNGAVCGHAFVKIQGQDGMPRLINLSPEYVSVVTDPDDMELVWRYIIEYPARGKEGERLTIRQVIERSPGPPSPNPGGGRWSILDQVATGSGAFVTRAETTWPWPWPPMIDCQNLPSPNEYYGISDVETDVIALNESLNFVLSNMARIIRYHAHPKTWVRGVEAKDMKMAADEVTILETTDGEMHTLEMQSDLASSIELYKRLKEALHEVTRVPEVATGKMDGIGALSGVALQILYAPLIQKIQTKRLTYGEMLIELNRRLFEMGGFGDDNLVEIHWPELLPDDPLQERQVALLDQQLGVSKDTILERLGFDPDLEAQKREAQAAELGEQLLTAFDRGAGELGSGGAEGQGSRGAEEQGSREAGQVRKG